MLLLVFIMAFVLALIGEIALRGFALTSLASDYFTGFSLLTQAESCLQRAALSYLREPNYAGESLQIETISCIIQLTSLDASCQEITCQCHQDQRSKTVKVEVTNNQGVFTFSPIQEK